MGNAISSASFKIEGPDDVVAVDAKSVRVRRAKINGNEAGDVIVSIPRLSRFSPVAAIGPEMLLENDFTVAGHSGLSFALIHALMRTEDRTQLKFDVFLCKTREDALQRLSGLVNGANVRVDEPRVVDPSASSGALMQLLARVAACGFLPINADGVACCRAKKATATTACAPQRRSKTF
jgi:hypothetical protein